MNGHRRLTERYPLRITIVVVLLTLVTAALLASGFTATTIMRGYLTDRVDSQLQDTAKALTGPKNTPWPGAPDAGRGPRLPSVFVVQRFDATGARLEEPIRQPLNQSAAQPVLPSLTLAQVEGRGTKGFNVPAVSGQETFRVIAVPLATGRGYLMVAQSLADMDQTLGRLVGVQVAAGLILLVLLAGVGTYVVRRSLRGLEDVEHTAVAIAGGDLSRRVPQRDPRTEVGRLSLALNQMLGQIEGAFAQRTASEFAARRSEDAARRSEENARQSEERMRRFVADASHELRTPLTSIRGFAELTRQQGAAADPATMKRIEDEAKRMGLLVDDLLLLARLDQQRPLQHQPVDLLTLAGDSVHDVQAVQPGRQVKLQILPASGAPVVSGDEARLRQVLGNLVSNALHHTPVDAPITISVGTRAGEAILEVADTGPGLNDEQKARVFERFYRADSARTRATGGSGLGLSIVAALVAAHGGKVTVTDTVPHGATFTVHLPIADSQ
ncbi:sensor histidine kinase [Kribbella sp. CA-293567]|uniref:sensor histidine kinase n=1 Tax=Kribbella sp. CA-293567 TaxID=3002436 RepID=UPI0022DDDDAF|nr:HAMP domain-containing sensor histidine kinase [Kribbella sp. CA-293567]WBQ02035.1 HAMP domain-containing sensor histidine kinase [Kribbella sp. CA-293567]